MQSASGSDIGTKQCEGNILYVCVIKVGGSLGRGKRKSGWLERNAYKSSCVVVVKVSIICIGIYVWVFA